MAFLHKHCVSFRHTLHCYALALSLFTNDIRNVQEYLHSREDRSVFVPAQQRILAAARLRMLDVRPALEEILVRRDACELACHGAVDVFHNGEVGGEEDVEIALVDL